MLIILYSGFVPSGSGYWASLDLNQGVLYPGRGPSEPVTMGWSIAELRVEVIGETATPRGQRTATHLTGLINRALIKVVFYCHLFRENAGSFCTLKLFYAGGKKNMWLQCNIIKIYINIKMCLVRDGRRGRTAREYADELRHYCFD